ncbi:hypothetical protein [Sporomusa aerivorans]|uniref:hypothetical protein n=1 Tax=Sporomusa aerivorans TaxID=204936 RepID=UPI00352B8B34
MDVSFIKGAIVPVVTPVDNLDRIFDAGVPIRPNGPCTSANLGILKEILIKMGLAS